MDRLDRSIINQTLIRLLLFLFLTIILIAIPSTATVVRAQTEEPRLSMSVLTGFKEPIKRGQDNKILVEVRNYGNSTINNINFSYTGPENINITFNPEIINILEPGEFEDIELTVVPASTVVEGDYDVIILGRSSEVTQRLNLFLRVESTPGFWLIIGIIILVIVIGAFIYVFFRFNRR